jgi:hypothetical protein
MSSNPKILTGLMERRALEAEFAALANTTDPETLVQRAQEIAQHGNAAIPVLLASLDSGDPQLRGGLGQVAARLERSAIVPALRAAARGRDRSDRARLAALTILDRYLHEPIEDALLAELQDPQTLAQESLRELLQEMARNPYSIIEYLTQLAEQPPDVPRMILDAIPSAQPNPHLATLLRMLAQDPDRALAQAAIEQLGRIRSGQAVRALATLQPTLPPDLAALAERARRKLRMSGATEAPIDLEVEPWLSQAHEQWLLISPVDAAGAQMTWTISAPDAEGRCTILSIVTQDAAGIVGCTELRGVPASDLPQPQGAGRVHRIAHRQGAWPIELLEAPAAAGRQTIQEALERNRANGSPTPLQYRLLNPVIWLHEGDGGPAAAEPPPAPDDAAAAAILLDHPAFLGWHWWPKDLPLSARWGAQSSGARARTAIEAALGQFGPEVCASYARRLRAMQRWLLLAGDGPAAALAEVAARQVEAGQPQESPFVQRLARAGFEVAQLR